MRACVYIYIYTRAFIHTYAYIYIYISLLADGFVDLSKFTLLAFVMFIPVIAVVFRVYDHVCIGAYIYTRIDG